MKSLDSIATEFFHAFYRKEWFEDGDPYINSLSIAEAYEVQNLVAQKRIELGESIAGFKIGCTSKAIRAQFGLNEPINGKLFRPHVFEGNVTVDWSDYVNCAIEPEMVLKIGKELKGENLSDEEFIDSIEYVSPGIEIHNFKFWNTPPTIQELICSGGIHAGLIIGSVRVNPIDLQFRDEMFYVYKDGIRITSAPALEIMGGPLHSLRWLVNFLTVKGLSLKKNSLVIPGSPVELVNIDQDTELKVVIENVGSLTAFFEKRSNKAL
ncbi:MAG: 2-keto-4-pentenoate hydratase [Planctomycetota bacterium]|jgi:2-keto-4-pentenoate hydratase